MKHTGKDCTDPLQRIRSKAYGDQNHPRIARGGRQISRFWNFPFLTRIIELLLRRLVALSLSS